MEISKVNEYSYSYAEYNITDGKYEIRCICNSVPLPNGLEPKQGMKIKKLYAFCYDENQAVQRSENNNYSCVKTEKYGFQYKVVGNIYDKENKLIKFYDFIVSLEFLRDEVLEKFNKGEYVSLIIDRFECDLEVCL